MKNLFEYATAIISDCGLYRYSLTRTWDVGPTVCWIMLNPSTADALQDDPTIRQCLAFSRAWDYGRLTVVNLFALRAKYPIMLQRVADPIGPVNDNYLLNSVYEAQRVVCAWGNEGVLFKRSEAVVKMLNNRSITTYCLGTTKSGQPKHPLYLGRSTQPVLFTGPTASNWRSHESK